MESKVLFFYKGILNTPSKVQSVVTDGSQTYSKLLLLLDY